MNDLDQQRISEWIGDAFAILCVRVGGISTAEKKLRLSFEALLRQLGTSPLGEVSSRGPFPLSAIRATATDLRHIRKALDSCLSVFARYDAVLSTSQRQVQHLVRATRRYADDELQARADRLAVAA